MGPAPPHAQGAELTAQPWSMVCSDQAWGHLAWEQDRAEGAALRQSLELHHSCSGAPDRNNIPAHTSRICCPGAGPRVGWDCSLQLGPGPFPATTLPATDPQLSSTSSAWPCTPSLPAPSSVGHLLSPLPHLGNSPPLSMPFFPTLHPCLPGVPAPHPSVPLPPSPTVPRLMLLSPHLVWVGMTWPLSPGGSLHPAGTETSAAVSPPSPAARHT